MTQSLDTPRHPSRRPSSHSIPRSALAGAALAALALAALAGAAAAQSNGGITLPPDGGNQRASVSQQIGLVRIGIEYSSPHVHSPGGEDRKGKIWGGLVPYGMANLGFGSCGGQCPWRGGANENTVFSTSHDIRVQGQPLPAGFYGLHFLPGKDEWTIIFSKNSTSWGSFSYDAKEDALRVQAKPRPSEYHEVLTYEFPERRLDTATVELEWENLALPFTVSVDHMADLYAENMARELRSTAGFSWEGLAAAARYCAQNKTHLADGLRWAKLAVDPASVGQENFTTLSTLAQLQEANGDAAAAAQTIDRALRHPTAGAGDIHQYARQLLAQKHPQEAMKIFELNAKLHPDLWPVHIGLARGYDALGDRGQALVEAKLALPQAPDDANRAAVRQMIQRLEGGSSIN
jgi:tetratricopeptide (TPR) repeat protein